MKRQIAKQVFGVRDYQEDQRLAGRESPQNQVSMEPVVFGSLTHWLKYLNASDTGAVYADLGDTSNIVTTSSYYDQEWEFKNSRLVFKFYNVTEYPIFLETYEIVAATSRNFDSAGGSDALTLLRDDILNSLKEELPTGTSTANTLYTGDNIFTNNMNTVLSYTENIKFDNKYFKPYWRVLKKRFVKLEPGDCAKQTLKIKNFRFNKQKYMSNVGSESVVGERIEIIKGITRALLIKFWGPVGRNPAVSGHGTIGYMRAELAFETSESTKLLPLWGTKKVKHHTVALDDVSAIELQHPGEHDLIANAG